MEGYKKTTENGLNIVTGDSMSDIEAVQENFEIHEKILGKLSDIEIDSYSVSNDGIKNIVNIIKFIWKKLNSIELTDLKVKVTTESGKTLDKVLKAIKNSIGTLTSLKTNEKNSTVGAINEVFDTTTNLKQAEILDRKDIVKLQNELSGEVDSIHLNNIEFARLLGVDINEIERSV